MELPQYLADKKDGKVNKGIFDIHVIDLYLTSAHSSPSVFDACSFAKVSNSKHDAFLDFYLHRFQHREELGQSFSSSLAYYSSSRSSSNLVIVT